ncbi:putative membrane protein [Caulobacter ginsengisoli]|uniref:Membrane protein n=1 Tax=Caulobacter ginsengisoli TaxID=400775 RepID=A0ABU0IMH3_9CAUL|nr:hypothetical protein [Caulobacter ginsengisoli]MDQ0462343.1 putative membrane protein [Caulobacter ginsengisoli]
MSDAVTVVAGIPIPSTSPVFLAGVGLHVAAGLVCVVTGAVAMLSRKAVGRHPTFGGVYYWSLAVVAASAAALAAVRWREDYQLFILACLAFAAAWLGRRARRLAWPGWPRWHIAGMGWSYILLLTAFYVDNGRNLPVWRDLPVIAYWTLPAALGLPLMLYALWRHPVVRRPPR